MILLLKLLFLKPYIFMQLDVFISETMNSHIRPNIQSMLIYLKDYLKLEFVVSNKFIFSLMEVFVSITFSGTEKMN